MTWRGGCALLPAAIPCAASVVQVTWETAWVRVSSPTVTGLYTSGRGFAVGPQVVIGTATAVAPVSGATLGDRGNLTVNNASVTGPTGQVVYRFEVSDSSGFANLAFVATVNQGANQTSASLTASAGMTGASVFCSRAI